MNDDHESLRVVHVAESMASGVEAAVTAWISCTPEFRHELMSVPSHAFSTGELIGRSGSAGTSGRLARSRDLASRYVRELGQMRPDVVHLHSSVAGYLGRTLPSGHARIVYSPHCFSFERQDLGANRRRGLLMIEKALSSRCDVVAVVGRYEEEIARQHLGGSEIVHIPNYTWSGKSEFRPGLARPMHVVGMGRLGPQKNAALFAALAGAYRGSSDVAFTWIGDGASSDRRLLESRGCTVTGWQGGAEARRILATGDVYVHTALWEGFPLAVVEAVAAGLPALSLAIPSLGELPPSTLFATEEEGSAKLARLLHDQSHRRDMWSLLASYCSGAQPSTVRAQLRRSYGVAT